MAITSYDDFIASSAAGYGATDHFYHQIGSATTATLYTGQNMSRQLALTGTPALPALPSGKTYFVPTYIDLTCTKISAFTAYKPLLMGSIDISGASGTFTAGSAAPTITEGGVSRQIPSAILMVVRTALNATPGTLTVTYIDQDNNTAETTASLTLTASAAKGTCAFVPLNSNDWGALQVTNSARSGGTTPTGIIDFYHMLPVGTISIPVAAFSGSINLLTDCVRITKFAAGEQIWFLGCGTTAFASQGFVRWGAM